MATSIVILPFALISFVSALTAVTGYQSRLLVMLGIPFFLWVLSLLVALVVLIAALMPARWQRIGARTRSSATRAAGEVESGPSGP